MSKLSDFTPTASALPEFIEDIADTDEIVIGGTATHTFELPFIYDQIVKSAKVIYKQSLEVKLVIDIKDSMVHIVGSKSVIYVFLPKVYTELFDDTVLDTYCQLEIITKDNEVLYDNPHKIKVLNPLAETTSPKAIVEDVKVNGQSVVIEGIADIAVPSNVSELYNDAGYITEAYHDDSKQDILVDSINIKTINNQSILGEGNLNIEEIFIKDYSDITVLTLSPQEFSDLTHNHYSIIKEAYLTIPEDLFTYDESYVTIVLGNKVQKIRLHKNNENSLVGVLVLNEGESFFDILVSLLTVNAELIAVIRCASIY